jgi:phosphoenolpyruvate synthase/pyruvate phosphate dikinase
MIYIKSLKQINKNDVLSAGGKGASLGEMLKAKIPVPDGFVILSNAFEKFIKFNDLTIEIDAALNQVDIRAVHTAEDASERIKALILDSKIPKEIANEILVQFKKLKCNFVAVRSSATSEDSSMSAWAGQLESYLNTTKKNILENVRKCWASLFTPRAIIYRFEKNFHKKNISVAVVIQKMVDSESSGVAFSVHPVTQDADQILIEAGFGLGEALVSGQITPDSYVIKKSNLDILEKNINVKRGAYYRSVHGGNKWEKLTKEVSKKQVLSDEKIKELINLIIKIENHYGFPVDIEWARDKDDLFIVQSRPITTIEKFIAKKKFTKEHSREYSLFRVATWYKAMDQDLPKIIGDSIKEACAVYRGEDLVEIYYDPSELKKLFQSVIKSCSNKRNMLNKIKTFLKHFNQFEKYFTREKTIESVKELKRFQKQYSLIWAYIAVVFMIPALPVDKELKKIAYEARTKTQKYNETPEIVFQEFIEKNFPKLKMFAKFILPEEIWSNKLNDEDLVLKLKKRKKGFVFYKNNLSVGDLENNLEKLGIILEERESVIAGKAEVKENELRGQVANKGKIKGIVRIVASAKELGKVKEGDILVAAMTMPKYLPAMRKASAFVTDEGGLTSHAAITAREMHKPCIVGTKIATNFLREGDLVEVDADIGIVRLLKRK